jgi:hypothetical protein
MIWLLIALNTFAYDFEIEDEPTEEEQVIHLDNLYLCRLCDYEVVVLETQENQSDSDYNFDTDL